MTVAEVIIALAVISVGLVALIAAMPAATSQIGGANLKTTATFLAVQRLEQIRNAKWTTGTDALGGAGSLGTAAVSVAGFSERWPDEGYGGVATYPRFRREVRIADCSSVDCSGIPKGTAGINSLRQVTVTVFFFPLSGTGQRQGSIEETVQLVTLVTQRP